MPSFYIAFLLLLFQQPIDGFEIAVCAVPDDGLLRGERNIGEMPEFLARVHIRDVYFYGGDRDCLQRVENGDARVRVGSGIDDDAVKLAVCRLDLVHDRALMIGLEALDLRMLSVQ